MGDDENAMKHITGIDAGKQPMEDNDGETKKKSLIGRSAAMKSVPVEVAGNIRNAAWVWNESWQIIT